MSLRDRIATPDGKRRLVRAIFATIADLRRRGLTVLVVEQNAHGALGISDTGIVMELGRLFMAGPAAEVIADPRIKVAYLGGEAVDGRSPSP